MSLPHNAAEMAVAYQKKFDLMQVSRVGATQAAANRISQGKARYKAVERMTGVPWWFIGVLHDREASCDFRGCLHNGDFCIGNGRKTWHVPKGCGPFGDWESSAVDALRLEGFLNLADKSPGMLLVAAEAFNGEGYHLHGWQNPYLWDGTQWYTRGKYVRDGVYDPNFVDPQIGVAPVMKCLMDMDKGTFTPIALMADPTRKGWFGQKVLHPEDHAAVMQHSRFLKWGERYSAFCEYLGLSGGTLSAMIPQVASFCTDWRTLTVAGVLGGGYLAMQIGKFATLNAAANGRYIPSGFWNIGQAAMADGPTVPVVPPTPEAAPQPSPTPPVASALPTDPALVAGLGRPAVVVEG
jgi:lysozyme family protein